MLWNPVGCLYVSSQVFKRPSPSILLWRVSLRRLRRSTRQTLEDALALCGTTGMRNRLRLRYALAAKRHVLAVSETTLPPIIHVQSDMRYAETDGDRTGLPPQCSCNARMRRLWLSTLTRHSSQHKKGHDNAGPAKREIHGKGRSLLCSLLVFLMACGCSSHPSQTTVLKVSNCK
jgi:hypothetical protein